MAVSKSEINRIFTVNYDNMPPDDSSEWLQDLRQTLRRFVRHLRSPEGLFKSTRIYFFPIIVGALHALIRFVAGHLPSYVSVRRHIGLVVDSDQITFDLSPSVVSLVLLLGVTFVVATVLEIHLSMRAIEFFDIPVFYVIRETSSNTCALLLDILVSSDSTLRLYYWWSLAAIFVAIVGTVWCVKIFDRNPGIPDPLPDASGSPSITAVTGTRPQHVVLRKDSSLDSTSPLRSRCQRLNAAFGLKSSVLVKNEWRCAPRSVDPR